MEDFTENQDKRFSQGVGRWREGAVRQGVLWRPRRDRERGWHWTEEVVDASGEAVDCVAPGLATGGWRWMIFNDFFSCSDTLELSTLLSLVT